MNRQSQNRTLQPTTASLILPLLAAAFFLGALDRPLCHAAPSPTTVEARGIRIVGPGEGQDFKDSVRPFNWSEGTTVAVLIRRPEGGIIEIDRDASTVTLFQDNTGTDLLKKPEQNGGQNIFHGQPGFGMMPQIEKDGTAVIVELDGPQIPAQGATTLKAQGTIQLVCARTKKRFTQEVPLQVGTKVTAGPVPFEITKVGKPEWGDAAMAVTFKATRKLDAIAAITFSANGKEIETQDGGSMSSKIFNVVKVEKTINFKQKVDAATIQIDAWQDMERVEVPLDLVIGLDLSHPTRKL